MTYPTTRIIFDRRKVCSNHTPGSVDIEIYYNKKRKWISTGVSVLKKNWKDGKMVYGRADAIDLNLRIEEKLKYISDKIRDLMLANKPFDWSVLDNSSSGMKESFIKYVERRIAERKDIKNSTKRNHKKLVNALKEFRKIRSFADISRKNILAFDEWLHSRKVYTQSTVASYHKFLKIYVNEALRNEYIPKNPYEGISIDRGKSKLRKYLTEEELKKIEIAKLPTASLVRARDLFIFQCYTGLAYADLANFDFKQVVNRNGRYVIHDHRQKTGENYYIVLLPKAIEVLERYNYELPIISNQQYNMRLKIIADAAGLQKNITSHMGRHTYATLCLNCGISIEILAKMMGHSDIKTTQIYAKLVNKTVEKAYDTLSRALEESSVRK